MPKIDPHLVPPLNPLSRWLRDVYYRTMLRRPLRSLAKPLDVESVRQALGRATLQTYSPALLERAALHFSQRNGELFKLAESICAQADEALTRGPFSVVDKTSLPVSGDPQDYWHPAPYYWPNPKTRTGIPYIERDGERVPGTKLYEVGSEKYDRSRLQRLFDDSTILALAWRVSGRECYARHATRHLIHWFVNPETRMNPHLKYAQIILTTRKGKWSSAGIIETKDFYYYLDAVRLLRSGGFIDEPADNRFKDWLRQFQDWLITSRHGARECAKPNNHGLLYDLQVAAISAFLDDTERLAATFRRARSRIFQHFCPAGLQPYELVRTLSAHYCTFNLQGWTNYARLAQNCGFDLWNIESSDGRSLERAMSWLLSHNATRAWPFRQIAPFDWDRLAPLSYEFNSRYVSGTSSVHPSSNGTAPPACFHPHDGIPPFWQLCLNDRSRGGP